MAIKMMMRLQFECPLTPQSAANPQLSACLPLSSPLSLARSWGLPAGPLSKTRPNWQQWRQAAAVISSGSGSSSPPTSDGPPSPLAFAVVAAIKSTQDMAGQGAANAAQYIKLYVDLSGSPKTLPDPQNWNRNGNWIPVLVFWRGDFDRDSPSTRVVFCLIVSFYWFIFCTTSSSLSVFISLFLSLFLFLSFEDFICVLIFD